MQTKWNRNALKKSVAALALPHFFFVLNTQKKCGGDMSPPHFF
jgi:hypothetical protein